METTTNKHDIADEQGRDASEPLGIYYIPDQETTNPPSERTYQEKAVWTTEGWEPDSEGEIVEAAAEHGPAELTAPWLREWFSNPNHVVGRPRDIPGDIERQDPTRTAADLGYEAELRTGTRGGHRAKRVGDGPSNDSPSDGGPSNDSPSNDSPSNDGLTIGGSFDGRARTSDWNALDRLLVRFANVCEDNCYRWVKGSFGFIFFYFGLQKWPLIRGASPVRPPVQAFVEAVGFGGWIPLTPETGLLLIGIYEVTLGTLWLGTFVEEEYLGTSRLFVGVAMMTVAHQLVAFLPLLLVPDVAFRQTDLWIPLVDTLAFPVALDWLSAFILKNLLFVGAFLYVYVEWAKRYVDRYPQEVVVPDRVDTEG